VTALVISIFSENAEHNERLASNRWFTTQIAPSLQCACGALPLLAMTNLHVRIWIHQRTTKYKALSLQVFSVPGLHPVVKGRLSGVTTNNKGRSLTFEERKAVRPAPQVITYSLPSQIKNQKSKIP
jgi:hypothetical protein